MTNLIVQSLILLSVVGLNYACIRLSKTNPNIISGFKISDEEEQRQKDLEWLKRLQRYMNIANVITLVGGFIAVFCEQQMVYFLFLVLPICFASSLAYAVRETNTKHKTRKNSVILLIIAIFAVTIATPILYTTLSDLKINFSENKIEISGAYGKNIKLQDIDEIVLCESLPEISIKTNGFALAKTRIGNFRSSEGKNVMLFTHSDKCFVRITLNNGTTYYMSCRDIKATEQLFVKMKKITQNNNYENPIAD